MPIYEYRCNNGHTVEVMQRMSEDPLSSCTTCHAPVQRVFHPVAVHFKGSGFYTTDYGKDTPKGSDETKSKAGSDKAGSDDSSKGSSETSTGSSKSDRSGPDSKASSSESKPSKSGES